MRYGNKMKPVFYQVIFVVLLVTNNMAYSNQSDILSLNRDSHQYLLYIIQIE